jgi:hypothetical protein
MPMPMINFQPVNPMDTLIKSALGVYGGINENRQRQAQANLTAKQMELIEAQLPFAAKIEAAKLGLTNAQMQKALQDAKNQEIMNTFIASKLQGMNGAGQPNQLGQPGMPPVSGAPNMAQMPINGGPELPINSSMGEQANVGPLQTPSSAPSGTNAQVSQDYDPYPGPSEDQMLFNSLIGVPLMTPEQQAAVENWKQRRTLAQTRNFENQYGTQTTVTDIQKQQKGIATFIPAINELIEIEVPGMLGFGGLPGNRYNYETKVHNALKKLMAAEGWQDSESAKQAGLEMLSIQPGETQYQYRERLKGLKNSLLETSKVLDDLKNGRQPGAQAGGEGKKEGEAEDPLGIR